MNYKVIYYIGCFLLFIGLFWILLPHAYHNQIISEVEGQESDIDHFYHILQGLLPTLLGLVLMISTEQKIKGSNSSRSS